MGRVQENHPHAAPNRIGDTFDNLVIYRAVGRMAPPDQHIGLRDLFRRQPMLGVLQGNGRGRDGGVGV